MIRVAHSAGFCFGVRRAVELAERLADRHIPAVTLGPLIHNPDYVAALARRGVAPVDGVEQAPPGCTVVIRSHGVDKATLEELGRKGYPVEDATCPFVQRIQRMAQQARSEGIPIIIVGDGAHPEVRGILGWSGGMGQAVMTEEEAAALPLMDKAVVAAQTTLPQETFDRICRRLKGRIKDMRVQCTICPATAQRQVEAMELARWASLMLVVGGHNSANSKKLFELCRALCPRTYFIESAAQLNASWLRPRDRIGMTAGASTPVCTFKEVVTRMSDIERQEQVEQVSEPVAQAEEAAQVQEVAAAPESTPEDDFMASVDKTLVQLRPGQTVTGTVLQITDDEVCVNVGYKADGLIKKADLSSTDVKVGDEIEVEVVKVNDGEGNVLLSQRNVVNKKNWDEIVAKYEAGEFVQGVGKEAVKGGLIATVLGIRTFIPASHLSQHYVEKIGDFVGQEMTLKIIEVDEKKKRIVASRKEVLKAEEAERKKQVWDTLEVGQVRTGIVRRLTDFGAFVDIGGVDGLVHVTDLCWHRVKHPSEVVQIKQEIPVKILALDPEKGRISLSYKQTQPRPWDVAGEKYQVGSVVEGKVVRITTFGAFVELEPGLDGLVHISQCALTRIPKVEDAVNVGDVVRVKILDVNTEARRISLSIRAVLMDEALDGVDGDMADEFAIEPAEAPAVEEVPVEAAEEAACEPEVPAEE
ncbi:MAG TPA: bifunctional 4-hydroxy-3-methylbut-2-enyl diphosphate reductase/30S ribosomal protein S1 [Candidatus Excrementavichristensenella intestinipullorum]|nr:bifunctional 4-hydroxy-3-methylbut-2-enyl diphosphate reductase/30S ribosomal protein S1 [Candidatus Excrementavichristensenella intestinipullorum]